jgi:hypothetical protein
MKNALITTKNFVLKHKEALIVGTALSAVVVLQNRGIQSLNKFLEEKDLFNEYYLPES